jgi:hypothetical protein
MDVRDVNGFAAGQEMMRRATEGNQRVAPAEFRYARTEGPCWLCGPWRMLLKLVVPAICGQEHGRSIPLADKASPSQFIDVGLANPKSLNPPGGVRR